MFNRKEYNREYFKNNKDKINTRKRRWYQKNKEKVSIKKKEYRKKPETKIKEEEYMKRWREKNKDKVERHDKTYYFKNKIKCNLKNKKYRENNRDKIKKYLQKPEVKKRKKNYMIEWNKNNQERIKMLKRKVGSKRRLILKGFIGNNGITKETQIKVWDECKGCCVYCKKLTNPTLPVNNLLQTTYDHIQEVNHLNPSIHLFDPNSIINMVIACRSCNSKRNSKPISKWCEEIGFIPEIIQLKLNQQKEQTKLDV